MVPSNTLALQLYEHKSTWHMSVNPGFYHFREEERRILLKADDFCQLYQEGLKYTKEKVAAARMDKAGHTHAHTWSWSWPMCRRNDVTDLWGLQSPSRWTDLACGRWCHQLMPSAHSTQTSKPVCMSRFSRSVPNHGEVLLTGDICTHTHADVHACTHTNTEWLPCMPSPLTLMCGKQLKCYYLLKEEEE